MEAMDAFIMNALHPELPANCPVHSETPGMMIDRLSILTLKAYHMALQVGRQEVGKAHRDACSSKLQVILAQKKQLAVCLNELLVEVTNKTRTFCVYHQFKMYNSNTLNPELYGQVKP